MKSAPNLNLVRQKFAVNRPNQDEVVYNPLYDFQAYAAAGATSLRFFQSPIGQGGKTEADTNMTQAGFLAAPQKFLIESVEVVFTPGVPTSGGAVAAANVGLFWRDYAAVMLGSALLKLTIGSKVYLRDAPLAVFAPSFRLAGVGAVAAHGDAAATVDQIQYVSAAGAPYKPYPLFIPPAQNFDVELVFPTAIATPSTVAGRIGVRLLGPLYRLSQ